MPYVKHSVHYVETFVFVLFLCLRLYSTHLLEPSIRNSSIWLQVTGDPRVVRKDVLHLAVCVPSSCSAQDVQNSLRASLSEPLQEQGLVANISLTPDDCYSVWEQPPFNSGYYIVM